MTSRACASCGHPIHGAAASRTKYCSGACRQKGYRRRNPDSIPVELRRLDRWVLWSPSKVPLQLDGTTASSTDPSTWTSYARVRAHQRKGFVLGGGIACLDIDNCLLNGQTTPRAGDILEHVPDAYVEISPSGRGLHVWGYAPEQPGRRRDGIESYAVGRYITITGTVFQRGALTDLSMFF